MAAHDFEAELSQPLPRPVRRRGGPWQRFGLSLLRVLLLPCLFVGGYLLFIALRLTGDSLALLGSPREHRDSPLGMVIYLWFWSLFWNSLLAYFVWQAYLRPWRHWRLVRCGHSTQGIVCAVRPLTYRNRVNYRVSYRYTPQTVDGLTEPLMTGSISATGPVAEEIRVGEVLTVLYDPQRPWRSLPYKLAEYAAWLT